MKLINRNEIFRGHSEHCAQLQSEIVERKGIKALPFLKTRK